MLLFFLEISDIIDYRYLNRFIEDACVNPLFKLGSEVISILIIAFNFN